MIFHKLLSIIVFSLFLMIFQLKIGKGKVEEVVFIFVLFVSGD